MEELDLATAYKSFKLLCIHDKNESPEHAFECSLPSPTTSEETLQQKPEININIDEDSDDDVQELVPNEDVPKSLEVPVGVVHQTTPTSKYSRDSDSDQNISFGRL